MIPTSTILFVIAGVVLIVGTLIGLIIGRTYLFEVSEQEPGDLSQKRERRRRCTWMQEKPRAMF